MRDITEVLLQRYPFLFIDRVVNLDERAGRITCLKNVSINEPYFAGHFPGRPVMPGVLILEALAQASILLFSAVQNHPPAAHPAFYFGRVRAYFKRPVVPGDQLLLHIQQKKIVATGGVVEGHASVKNETVAKAEMVFSVRTNEP